MVSRYNDWTTKVGKYVVSMRDEDGTWYHLPGVGGWSMSKKNCETFETKEAAHNRVVYLRRVNARRPVNFAVVEI